MNCREFEKNITGYLDGSLTETLKREMDKHRTVCRECRKLVAIQRMVSDSLNNAERVRAPKGLAERILSAAEREIPENVIEFTPHRSAAPETARRATAAFDCKTVGEHAAAYVDGALDRNTHTALEQHLKTCPLCTRLVRMHTVILNALNTAHPVHAPEGLAETILTAAAKPAVSRVYDWKTIGSAAAVIAALGSLTAALVTGAGEFMNRLTVSVKIYDYFGTLWTYAASMLLALKDTAYAKIVYYAPTLPEKISYLADPVTIPYTAYSIPPYILLGILVLTWFGWNTLRSPVGYMVMEENN